jgi:hypothetical protein
MKPMIKHTPNFGYLNTNGSSGGRGVRGGVSHPNMG